MNLSLEFLQRCSAETGFQSAVLEKVARIGEIAGNIARDPTLADALVLKGGTALNLCYGPLRRLSVDLDFNYVGSETRDDMLRERPIIHEGILNLATRLGYRQQESAKAFSGGKIYLSYRSAFGTPDRIELDLNFLFRIPFSGTVVQRLWQPGELDQPYVRIVGTPELLIGKLLALLDRGAARDVWDIANLPQPLLDVAASEQFRRHFIAFSAILPHPLSTYTQRRLERLTNNQKTADQLSATLIANEPVNMTALIERAWNLIERFMHLSADEAAYVTAIGLGELRLDLLFPNDQAEAELFERHPAIQWKLKNVRERLKRT